MIKKIHIVSFDVPYPPNYGGIIDVYFKIKHLHNSGVKVYLHTYEYGKGQPVELNEICEEVFYYKKRNFLYYFLSNLPFSVRSRSSKLLFERLKNIESPIIYEGLKSTHSLINKTELNHGVFIRSHNIEHEYLKGLAKSENSLLKKTLFNLEAKKLERFQKIMEFADGIFSISPFDHNYFNQEFKRKSSYIPVFHANNEVSNLSAKGVYSLYHGDLRISDNLRAAHFLIEIFKDLDYPLIIAGGIKNKSILKKIAVNKHITFAYVPPNKDMTELISKAHINILPTFQKTGIKLKLINALFNGRFCLVTRQMVEETGLESLCHIASSKAEFKEQIIALNRLDYSEEMKKERAKGLALFNNEKNAKKLIEICDYTTS